MNLPRISKIFLSWLVSCVVVFVVSALLFRAVFALLKGALDPSVMLIIAGIGNLTILAVAVLLGGFIWTLVLKAFGLSWPGPARAPYFVAGTTMIPVFTLGATLFSTAAGFAMLFAAGLISAFLVDRAYDAPAEAEEAMKPSNEVLL